MKILISFLKFIIILLFLFLWGCSSTSSQNNVNLSNKGDASTQLLPNELSAIDQQLNEVEEETLVLRSALDQIQADLSTEMSKEAFRDLKINMKVKEVYIELDRDNQIRVNGVLMSEEEFEAFTIAQGQMICSPTPIFVACPKADYDLSLHILDLIYAQLCSNVKVIKQINTP